MRVEISYLVLASDPERAEQLAKRLRDRGCRAGVATDTKEAVKRCSATLWTCLVFERELTETLDDFFAQFPARGVCFAPWAVLMNDLDAIDALNSRRCAYYLADPVPDGELDKLVSLADWHLNGRTRETGIWLAERAAEIRPQGCSRLRTG